MRTDGYISFNNFETEAALTHWGRVTHICVSKITSIGSDNGLSPGRRQAIVWINAGMLLIWPLETNLSEIFIEIHIFSLKKMHLKMSSAKCRPFCLGLNVLNFTKDFLGYPRLVYPKYWLVITQTFKSEWITMELCICHDSTTLMPCGQFHCDWIVEISNIG